MWADGNRRANVHENLWWDDQCFVCNSRSSPMLDVQVQYTRSSSPGPQQESSSLAPRNKNSGEDVGLNWNHSAWMTTAKMDMHVRTRNSTNGCIQNM